MEPFSELLAFRVWPLNNLPPKKKLAVAPNGSYMFPHHWHEPIGAGG
jgi:hypothetical protein